MSDQFVTGDHIRAEPWPDLDIALIAERDFACVVCWVFPQSLDRRVEGLGEPSGPLGRKLGIGALLFVPTIRFHAHVSSGLSGYGSREIILRKSLFLTRGPECLWIDGLFVDGHFGEYPLPRALTYASGHVGPAPSAPSRRSPERGDYTL